MVILLLIVNIKLTWMKKILLISILSVLLPQISSDYKLEFIVIAVAILIYARQINIVLPDRNFFTLLLLFLIVIIPKHYIFFRHFADYGEFVTIQSLINPLLLITAFIFTLKLSDIKK